MQPSSRSARFIVFVLILFPAIAARGSEPVALRDGDRVVLLGGTFIERMQAYGYVETMLTAGCSSNVTFRNLGWSGDNVFGEARALFGTREEGFKRLVNDVKAAEPTVIVVAYGSNEAHQGDAGLSEFAAGTNRLFDALAPTGARFVVLLPFYHGAGNRRIPPPHAYNKRLSGYRDTLRQIAEERDYPIIDLEALFGPIAAIELAESKHCTDAPPLSDNGIHLSAFGYWAAAPWIAQAFGAKVPGWKIDYDLKRNALEATGCMVGNILHHDSGIRFSVHDRTLPPPNPPPHLPPCAPAIAGAPRLRVAGLPPGRYELRVDGNVAQTKSGEEWAAGCELISVQGNSQRAGVPQTEQLRRAIGRKNEFYFHRYRPQNETYLFLFRQHEQGNNAVEIPQFDPLVAEQEQLIAELKRPRKHVYELVRVEEE